jgi:hypothetical protein
VYLKDCGRRDNKSFMTVVKMFKVYLLVKHNLHGLSATNATTEAKPVLAPNTSPPWTRPGNVSAMLHMRRMQIKRGGA